MSEDYNDFRVIETKLEALTDLVKMGFGKIDLRFDRFDDRVARLETEVAGLREFRAATEAREALEDDEKKKGNPDWSKIVLALITVLSVALAIIGQLLGNAP